MKILNDTIHEHFVLVEEKIIRTKTDLIMLEDRRNIKNGIALVLSGENEGKLMVYLKYDRIEVENQGKKHYLVPKHHLLCEVEIEESETAIDANSQIDYVDKGGDWHGTEYVDKPKL